MRDPEVLLGEQIRAARKARGWNQERLAQEMNTAGHEGFHQTTISKTEDARRSVGFAEAVAFASILGLDLASLTSNQDQFNAGYQAALRDIASVIESKTEREGATA